MSKRRPNGDGMVRKRPDGRWEARIIVGHKEDGKPIYKSVFGKTQSEAMTKFYKLLETYRGVELNEDCLVNLNEWLDRWLCYQKDVVRPQTLNKYIFYADAYVRPYLGDKKISAILTRDMQQLYVKLLKEGRVTESKTKGKSLSGSTVRAVHMMMHKCFEMAVEQHIIVKNPTDGTIIPALNSTERKVYNEEQLKKFLKIIEDEPWWRDFFYLECMTGLRKGEICGLRWEDFNEAEGRLSIARQVIPVRGGITVSDPKTDTGIRTIVLPESVVRMLKERKKAIGSEWIFPSLRDAEKPINPNTAYGTFKRIIKKAGLPDIPFHGLRHTYATHSIAVGVDEKTLAKELGHTKPGFTLDCYAHVTEEMQKRASEVTGNALEKILGKELKPWADERTDKG